MIIPMTLTEHDVRHAPSYIECEVCERRIVDDPNSVLRLENRAHQRGWEKHEGTIRCEQCKVSFHLYMRGLADCDGNLK